MKKIKKVFMIIIIIIAFLTTGCWDYRDTEKKTLVLAVGVDKLENNVQFSTENVSLTAEEGLGIKTHVDVAVGKNFEEARVNVNSIRANPTFLGTTRVVIFGQKYAKEGIKSYINRINKMYDYRKTLLAVVSREPAEEILKVKPKSDVSAGFFIEHNIDYLSNKGYGLYTNIGEILSKMALDQGGYVLPYIGIEQNQIKYLGAAVMKDSKLIDVIDVEETEGLLYILSDNVMLTEEVYSKGEEKDIYSFITTKSKKKIKTKYENGEVIIDLKFDLKERLQYQYYNLVIDNKKIKTLESRLSEKIKDDIEKAVKKTQQKYKCDIFNFIKYFKAQNPEEYRKISWIEKYPKAKINIDVNVTIVNENLSDDKPKAKK